jgi:hypothetical protein
METYCGIVDITPRILWPRHYMEVSGQLHAPAALLPGKESLVPIG